MEKLQKMSAERRVSKSKRYVMCRKHTLSLGETGKGGEGKEKETKKC